MKKPTWSIQISRKAAGIVLVEKTKLVTCFASKATSLPQPDCFKSVHRKAYCFQSGASSMAADG